MLKRTVRPRVLIYGALLLVLGSSFLWSLSQRADFRVDLSRDRGSLARMTGPGNIENTYTLHITNSDEKPHRYTVSVDGPEGIRLDTPAELAVAATSDGKMPVRLVLPAAQAMTKTGQTLPVHIEVRPMEDSQAEPKTLKSTFLVPR